MSQANAKKSNPMSINGISPDLELLCSVKHFVHFVHKDCDFHFYYKSYANGWYTNLYLQ